MRYLTIHGHFYQPPRENPYLEKIETQESAFPYHDWNTRINDECYRPNTCSRILTGEGRIADIVNNYEYMSFNFGPTLLNWLAQNDPQTYHKIIEADRLSCARNNGHGNAMAQVYNHAIMPLASYRDKLTQIRWGIDDFRRHFGREPEGMWLAETAINPETVRALIENGIKFTILSPYQAEKTRLFFSNSWQNVEDGSIDPSQPYRIFLDDDPARHLDVFFYDAPISTAVSFEHLLRDANEFAKRLSLAAMPKEGRPTLIHIATDGESYGHHEPFGDMCLAYFFKHLVKEYRFRLINYGYFLELYSPVSEVVLKQGLSGEGTAWSCSHGVGRWKEDCGCSTHAGHGWNQQWRKPLREGLNVLRDLLWETYVSRTAELLNDPEEARHHYYRLFSGLISREEFMKTHLRRKSLSEADQVMIWSLLESQRHGQLMFTSCGWFFADISGIETVQIMKYANIAIRYAQPYTEVSLETRWMEYLEQAKSNLGSSFDGSAVYQKWLKPYELDEYRAINQYLVEGEYLNLSDVRQIYLYLVSPGKLAHAQVEEDRFILVKIETEHVFTAHRKQFLAVLFRSKQHSYTWICLKEKKSFDEVYRELASFRGVREAVSFLGKHFRVHLGMNDLNFESSSELMTYLWEKKYAGMIHSLDREFFSLRELIQSTIAMGGFLPHDIKGIVEIMLSATFDEELKKIDGFMPDKLGSIVDVVTMAHKLHIGIRKERAKAFLEKEMLKLIAPLSGEFQTEEAERAIQFFLSLDRLDVQINKTVPENVVFDLYRRMKSGQSQSLKQKSLTRLAQILNLDIQPG